MLLMLAVAARPRARAWLYGGRVAPWRARRCPVPGGLCGAGAAHLHPLQLHRHSGQNINNIVSVSHRPSYPYLCSYNFYARRTSLLYLYLLVVCVKK